jgi:hypothetical protein
MRSENENKRIQTHGLNLQSNPSKQWWSSHDEFGLTPFLFHTSKGSLTCRKILHVADGFTSPWKEGVLHVFVAPLKIHSP